MRQADFREPPAREVRRIRYSRTSENAHLLTWSNAPKLPITQVRLLIEVGNRLTKPVDNHAYCCRTAATTIFY